MINEEQSHTYTQTFDLQIVSRRPIKIDVTWNYWLARNTCGAPCIPYVELSTLLHTTRNPPSPSYVRQEEVAFFTIFINLCTVWM